MRKVSKGFIVLAVFIIMIVVLVYPTGLNAQQTARDAAEEALDEYIVTVEELRIRPISMA